MSDVKSIILVGVGGQGAILVSKVLTKGLIKAGYDVKMSEVHGMSQRGGSVSTQVRFGSKVYSPIIGKGQADILVSFEKMEAVRYAPFLKPEGTAVINDYEIVPMNVAAGEEAYPEGTVEAMQSAFKTVVLNAAKIAIDLGNAKCMNIVLFGAMVKALGLTDIDWEEVLKDTVPPKFLDLNLKAYKAGYNA
jgi:indolepyruvate ferredoxin oxidoreductase beta subunit